MSGDVKNQEETRLKNKKSDAGFAPDLIILTEKWFRF